jgi:uncharacterized protein
MTVGALALHANITNIMSIFQIYTDVAGGHRWRLKAPNGEIVATSESYTTRTGAKQSALNMKGWVATATFTELN